MPRLPPRTSIHVFRLPPWAMALLGIAVGAMLLALGLALFVVLAPLAVGLFFYVRWRMRRVLRDMQQRQDAFRREAEAQQGNIIDADYVVIEDPERRRG